MNNGQMKFRVWDGCKMILIEGDTDLMFFNSPNRLPWAVYDYTKARIADGHKWSGEVLMQSTGLIDKNSENKQP